MGFFSVLEPMAIIISSKMERPLVTRAW